MEAPPAAAAEVVAEKSKMRGFGALQVKGFGCGGDWKGRRRKDEKG